MINKQILSSSTPKIKSLSNATLAAYAAGRYRAIEAQREIARRDRKHAKAA